MRILNLIPGLMLIMSLCTCELPRDAPDDHTIELGGVWHKPGLENPTENCVECHRESRAGPISCLECHK